MTEINDEAPPLLGLQDFLDDYHDSTDNRLSTLQEYIGTLNKTAPKCAAFFITVARALHPYDPKDFYTAVYCDALRDAVETTFSSLPGFEEGGPFFFNIEIIFKFIAHFSFQGYYMVYKVNSPRECSNYRVVYSTGPLGTNRLEQLENVFDKLKEYAKKKAEELSKRRYEDEH